MLFSQKKNFINKMESFYKIDYLLTIVLSSRYFFVVEGRHVAVTKDIY